MGAGQRWKVPVAVKTLIEMEALIRRADALMLVYGNPNSEQCIRAGVGAEMQEIIADALKIYAKSLTENPDVIRRAEEREEAETTTVLRALDFIRAKKG